jgi:hypothetical protein
VANVNAVRAGAIATVFAVAACKGPPPTRTRALSGVEASAGPSAAAAPAATRPDAAETTVFHSVSGQAVSFAAEVHGSSVRAVLDHDGIAEFHGSTDGARFDLESVGTAEGRRPFRLTGAWSDAGVEAILVDPGGITSKLRAARPPFDGSAEKLSGDFKGWLARRFIRMQIERNGSRLHGVYRYTKSAQDIDLEGTVDAHDGTFVLTESLHGGLTGRFAGVFAGTSAMLATWSAPSSSTSTPLLLESGHGQYPATVALAGGLTLYPQETVVDDPRCARDILYPQVRGAKDVAKAAALNRLLRGDRGDVSACFTDQPFDAASGMGFVSETKDYAFLTSDLRARFVGLSWTESVAASGAVHPNSVTTCTVLDTAALTHFRLNDHLTSDGRARLGQMVSRELVGDGGKLDQPRLIAGPIEVQATTNVCLLDHEVSVRFGRYELGGYALGEPEATFPKAAVRDLFESSELMDAVFAQ